jgi:DNA polymerase V
MIEDDIKFFEIAKFEQETNCELPLYAESVSAGLPFHADDSVEKRLDLNELLVKHPTATFFVKVQGDSMIGAGIFSGDILLVDRSIEPVDGAIVIAELNGEFTVKRLKFSGGRPYLLAENPNYKPIQMKEGVEFAVWGVVTSVIRKV